MEEGRIQTTVAALQKHFEGEPRDARIALGTGTRSPWVSRLLNSYGHEVIVANPRKIPTLTGSESKNDRNDAEQLARMAAFDPKLLHPIEHRSLQRQQDLNLIHTRSVLVRARTMLVNSARGLVKSAGGRLPNCSSEALPDKVSVAVPGELKAACEPLLKQIAQMNRTLAAMDKRIGGLAKNIRRSLFCVPPPDRSGRGGLLCVAPGQSGKRWKPTARRAPPLVSDPGSNHLTLAIRNAGLPRWATAT